MEKPTTKLSAQDRVILFCVATGIDHGSVGIIDYAMQSMAIRGFIAHNRESGAYTLTDSGRCRDWDYSVTALGGEARFRTDRAGLSESRRCIGKPLPAAALTRKGFPAHWQTG
jgi:hypothetical protein